LKAGHATDFTPHTRWGSDIEIIERKNGKIINWLTGMI
jgi:hypothetical protein